MINKPEAILLLTYLIFCIGLALFAGWVGFV